MVVMMASSCVTPQSGLTVYQQKNVNKFLKKKRYRTSSGPRYVRPYKRGNVMHPAVTKESRREMKRRIISQKYTTGN